MSPLGRLERVDLRQVWQREAGDFTPWLAEKINLELLGDTIGLDLELEAVEKSVGPFRADILCKETASEGWVLIENQLERTDHTHLGQIMTYAASLGKVTVVWIAQRFTDEHRATLDWLNEITGEGVNFFGLEVELWRIGDSTPAPKFNIISQPNDWLKSGRTLPGESGGLTPTQQLQLEFWQGFRALLLESQTGQASALKPQKASAQHWTSFSIGRSNFNLFAAVNTRNLGVSVGLVIATPDAKQHFALLESERERIETEVGQPLLWKLLPDGKESRIELVNTGVDPRVRSSWPIQYAWLQHTLERFHRTFALRIKQLTITGDGPGVLEEGSESANMLMDAQVQDST